MQIRRVPLACDVVKLPPCLAGDFFEGRLVTDRGKPQHDQERLKYRRAAAGLDTKVRPYSLRHTAARWICLKGVPAEEVAQQLGH